MDNMYEIDPPADFVVNSHVDELQNMFPEIDRRVIQKLCLHRDTKNKQQEFYQIVDLLLVLNETDDAELRQEMLNEFTRQSNQPIEQKPIIDEDQVLLEALISADRLAGANVKMNEKLSLDFIRSSEKEEKLEILENILPNFNPDLLREFVEKNPTEEEMMNFTDYHLGSVNKLNKQSRIQHFSKLKNEQLIAQYTKNFKIEKFLEHFPYPIEYFENVDKKRTYNEEALNFLKMRYQFVDSNQVENYYVWMKHSLSLADEKLQEQYGKGVVLAEVNTVQIPLLQEIAYIQNKEDIKEYLRTMEIKDEQIMNALRKNGLITECQCCFDDMKLSDVYACGNDHLFCKRCINKGTDMAISCGKTVVLCFQGCGSEIPLQEIKRGLPHDTYETFLKKRQEAEIDAAKIENLSTCPFCPYSMELSPEIKIFKCQNSECKLISCRLCKKVNHLPLKCEEVLDTHKSRLLLEEEMSKVLIRVCYRCQKPFVKTHGCNLMTCTCGARMCYVCKAPIKNHDHFITSARCAVNSDVLNTEQLKTRKSEVISYIETQFPDVEIPKVD
ncbi:E3 ubiquitin-protein ligase RNF216-like [Trichogramma pretiosum]|uniref:E3 ubiquitin-protein ligase RNF216-like n=1 Tax=Trichogramma pretiosum TaxID=7493 RepID=UPI0006C9924E|nr:E3 ubiquitin-protein ligase RNF216-like [Trichogramma pretiosum]